MQAIDQLLDQHEASLLIQELRAEIRAMIRAELGNVPGAHRDYSWTIGDPTVTPAPADPAPASITLTCRPIELVAACLTAPTSTATFHLARSIDNGATYQTITETATTIASGAVHGAGATFKWEDPTTRALSAPTTTGTVPLTLRAGDKVKLVATPSAAKSLSVILRTQRLTIDTTAGR